MIFKTSQVWTCLSKKNSRILPQARGRKPNTKLSIGRNTIRVSKNEISLYFPQGDLRTQFINESPYVEGIAGQQATYKPAYIELMFMLYRLFGWGLRQITGYFKDLWRTRGLNIPVPSFGHLSDLFCSLPLKVRHFCQTLAKRLGQGERLSLIFDSTGLRFGKASHWYEAKYDKPCDQKPWRKMHLSIDPEMNVHEGLCSGE